jgi:hypothetical protein
MISRREFGNESYEKSDSDDEKSRKKSKELQRKAMDGIMERVDEMLEEDKVIKRPKGERKSKKEFNNEGYEKKI